MTVPPVPPPVPEMGALIADIGAGLLEATELLSPSVLGAGAAGYLLGTAIDEATGNALSGAVLDGLEFVFGEKSEPISIEPPPGTEAPDGRQGHWVHDPQTPDIDATWVDEPGNVFTDLIEMVHAGTHPSDGQLIDDVLDDMSDAQGSSDSAAD